MESEEGRMTMPFARVRRDGSGHFAYDQEFIPPCLQIGASESLMRFLQRLIEILAAKNASLSRTSGSVRDNSYGEISNFWLLHAINSALAPLTHQFVSRRGHPEELFIELLRLGGALCTFALNSDPASLPAYDHRNPGPGFIALDIHIRKHLELVVPTNCIAIKLEKTAEFFFTGEIQDTRCFGRSNWILVIRSPIGDVQLIARTPQLAKVCSAKFVAELVRRAIAGLPLRHLPVPPAAMPARMEAQCFAISKEGPFWDNIVQTRAIGIYVPGDIPGAELELFVVLEA
jgi:type VI secretion system protein ImpJ